jgi:Na+-transporting methylmalonyl-CoA/oxaloacetate decarboxylase gamma subunit
MKKLIRVFAVLIMLFSFMACVGHDVRQEENPEQVVAKANRHLPQRVDPVMTLEKVSRNRSTLTYHYVIDLEALTGELKLP